MLLSVLRLAFYVVCSVAACAIPTHGSGGTRKRQFRHRTMPILFCLTFWFVMFSLVYVLLLLLSPHCTSFSKISPVPNNKIHCHCRPTSYLSSCLNKLHSFYFSIAKRNTYFSLARGNKTFSLLLILLLLLSGDVELNPGPDSFLSFSCLNVRSATSTTANLDKPVCIQEFITDNSLDILSLTETWLQPDASSSTLKSLTPQGFSYINSPRPAGRGGGIAVIYKSTLQVKTLKLPSYVSFESLGLKFSCSTTSFTCIIIYRPPAM
jgi:hypothetical protein